MPLIRAIGRFFNRRMSVDVPGEQYGDLIRAETRADLGGGAGSLGASGMVWAVIMLVALPLIVLLVLIGLLYEVIVHVGGRRLPAAMDWLIASAVAIAIVGGALWLVLPH
jgi:hypothetical protein